MLKKELLLVLGIGFIGFFNAQEIKKKEKRAQQQEFQRLQ